LVRIQAGALPPNGNFGEFERVTKISRVTTKVTTERVNKHYWPLSLEVVLMFRALIGCLLFLPVLCFGQFTGKVVEVTDGDTYQVKRASGETVTVRLYGVDCPESSQSYRSKAKRQWYGPLVPIQSRSTMGIPLNRC